MAKKVLRSTYRGLEKFLQLLILDRERKFHSEIIKARRKVRIPKKYLLDDSLSNEVLNHLVDEKIQDDSSKRVAEEADKRITKFLKNEKKDKLVALAKEVDKILKINNLENEWIVPVSGMIICNYFSFPAQNFVLLSDKKLKEVSMQFTSTTSLADVMEWWGYIGDKQKEIFGKKRGGNITKKSIEYIMLGVSEDMAKDRLKAMDEYRGIKISDMHVASAMYEDSKDISQEMDIKRAGKIRKVRHILRKKGAKK